jgi:hypothetical protein
MAKYPYVKNYPYRVVVNSEEVRKSRRWCIEEYGNIPLKRVRRCDVYDEANSTWVHRLNDQKVRQMFFFRYRNDAMKFCLSRETHPEIEKRYAKES